MDFRTIISPEELKGILRSPDLAVVDCRFYLDDPGKGFQEYLAGHIPGAIYADLDRDLSGEIIPGKTGRHPLPDSAVFVEQLSKWGIDESTQVVAYDDRSGAIAARLWWLLRWLGHERVAVLNGDIRAWVQKDFSLESGENNRPSKEFIPHENPEYFVDPNFVDQIRQDENYLLLDARSPERYWGLKESIDNQSGHIPGAVTAPYEQNLDPEGNFLPASELRERYESLLNGLPPQQVVVYCGSGVTAIHNLIAMVEAGYDLPLLYPGSWSEWITDPGRPVSPSQKSGS
jgi:thiosulfate/3-mercaptopyruvate sulfurtransferase